MEVKATLKYLRISPKKVRLVTDVISGMDYIVAKNELTYRIKRSAHPVLKLLETAVANAHHNYGLVKENMFIKSIIVGEGPALHRYKPKSFGSSMPITKRTSHITIILDERVPGMKASPDKKEAKTDNDIDSEAKSQVTDISPETEKQN